VLIQLRQDSPINVILGEQVSVLGESNLFQPALKIGHLGNPNASGGWAIPRKERYSARRFACRQVQT
jgi:hypothetical protein